MKSKQFILSILPILHEKNMYLSILNEGDTEWIKKMARVIWAKFNHLRQSVAIHRLTNVYLSIQLWSIYRIEVSILIKC